MAADPRHLLFNRQQDMWQMLNSAVETLNRLDSYLLQSDLKEEAINHRLAIYLENAINSDAVMREFGFCTDCEYSRFGLDEKTVPNTWDPIDLPERERDRQLRPDIIVHQRGNDIGQINLLTVEVKKSSTVSNRARQYALWKSEAYRSSNLAYIFAAYICLNCGADWQRGQVLREFRLFPE